MKLKSFLVLTFALFFLTQVTDAAALSPGDIVIVSFQADTPDLGRFAALVDIPQNEEIIFTDNGVFADGTFATTEGTITWTAPNSIPAGTIVEFSLNGLSTGGDQMIAFQGSLAAPTFLAAFQSSGLWQLDRTSSTTSAEPPGLANGQSLAIAPHNDNAQYDCSVSVGTKTVLFNAINDPTNWFRSNSVLPLPYTCSLTVLPTGSPNGDSCSDDADCESSFCTDGVCCQSSCGGGIDDCQACDGAATGGADGECLPNLVGSLCGDSATECSGQDTCDGFGVCEINDLVVGTTCGDAGTECSGQDTCNGSGVCEINDLVVGTTCGDAGTECSGQDTCNGSGVCEINDLVAGTTCGDAATECSDQDTCNGSGVCEINDLVVGTTCGDVGTECSGQDTCDGSGTCAINDIAVGTFCGDAATECSGQDTCDGAGSCAINDLTIGTFCGNGATECSAQDTCDGGGLCQLNDFALDTACGDATNTECNAFDACDGAGTCENRLLPVGSLCGDAPAVCTGQDTCNGAGTCLSNDIAEGTMCGDATNSACSDADTCDGSGICLDNHRADGFACQTGSFCLKGDSCVAGVCVEGVNPTCLVGEKCIEDTLSCIQPCGDGELDPGEVCDNGDLNSDTEADACRTTCVDPSCGDGVTDPSLNETCDDGGLNADIADTCRTNCVLPTCGDGIVDRDEGCDLGDENSDDPATLCRLNCVLPTCNDGILDAGEECDNGADNSDLDPDACRTMCKLASCGDGVVDSDEACDGGDECTPACEIPVVMDPDSDMGNSDTGSDMNQNDIGVDGSGSDVEISGGIRSDDGCGCGSTEARQSNLFFIALLGFFVWSDRRRKRHNS